MITRIESEVVFAVEQKGVFPVSDMPEKVVVSTDSWLTRIVNHRDLQWTHFAGMNEIQGLGEIVDQKIASSDIRKTCGPDCRQILDLTNVEKGMARECELVLACTRSFSTEEEATAAEANCAACQAKTLDNFQAWVVGIVARVSEQDIAIDKHLEEIKAHDSILNQLL